MITIDNKEVTRITINGDKVNKITMDGVIVWLENLFSITYETSAEGIKTIDFDTGADLRQFIMDNKSTFINHCKVVAKLPEITDCSDLFYECTATSLDLSSFDTSNVTNMSDMFFGSFATTLDLSSFDTSNVTDMSGMFAYSSATTLDLSSFDTSSVTDMSDMFATSSATTGYARTQADADKFNASIADTFYKYRPLNLTFVVK